MSNTVKQSYDWIKYLPSSILQWDEIPLLGLPPPFPWDGLSQGLSQLFNIENIKIEHLDTKWRLQEDLLQGYPHPFPIYFSVTSMEGHLTWLMNRADLESILATLILKSETRPPLTNPGFMEGFYEFIAMQVLHHLSQLEWDKTLSIHAFMNGELPLEPALCIDVNLFISPRKLNGRLVISNAFRKSWMERYTPKTPDAYLQAPLAEQLTLPLGVEAGKTVLTQQEWKEVSLGDFIIVDQYGIDPDTNQGQVVIKINDRPIFNAQFEAGHIKILESTQPHEEEQVMETPPNQENHEYEDDEELNFDEEDFDLDHEEEDEEFNDEEFDEDFDNETAFDTHETLAQPKEPHAKVKKEAKPPKAPEAASEIPTEAAPPTNLFSPTDIPLSISVEIGRFQLSIQKLMELAPGNMLELGVKPDNGVDLVFNGKCIARGELLRIGETLGVRILEKK